VDETRGMRDKEARPPHYAFILCSVYKDHIKLFLKTWSSSLLLSAVSIRVTVGIVLSLNSVLQSAWRCTQQVFLLNIFIQPPWVTNIY